MDETFDAHAELKILEDKEEEERLQAVRADIDGKFDVTVQGWAEGKAKKDKDMGGSSQANKSRQEKRAEARAEAKAKDNKQTKD